MRQVLGVVFALVAGCLGCCGTESLRPASPTPARAAASDTNQEPLVVLDVAVIECHYGDRFLMQELWQQGDEQGVDLEVQASLEDNGLRVCRIGGMLPARLQALLSTSRNCAQPRRLRAQQGKSTPVPFGPVQSHFRCRYRDVEHEREIVLDQAQSVFEIEPFLEDEGRLKLRFRPSVKYGKPLLAPRVENEPGGTLAWRMDKSEPVQEFPGLSWDLLVAPDEFVIIGCRTDRPDSLGEAFFVPGGKAEGKRTVLVLRASVLASGEQSEIPAHRLPLAAQASLTARGSAR